MKYYSQQPASDTASIISKPPSKIEPSLSSGDKIHNSILDLSTILNRADKIPNLPETCNTSLLRVLKDDNMKLVKDASPEVLKVDNKN